MRDRGIKKAIYAAARIAVYWVVNLLEGRIEVYSDPIGSGTGADYATCESFGVEDRVPLVVDGLSVAEIPAREILP